jgi:geranylgeranyl transferase type-1 subunit beta
MTFTALCMLRLLGDDFSRVERRAVLRAMRALQQPDGNFQPVASGAESDVRFVYCAACVCTLLQDWSGMDVAAATRYLLSCLSYEGAFGAQPGLEAHGGTTYCAYAALWLMGAADRVPREPLLRWCLDRQLSGFQGRCNKDPDTCYSFWIGATLALLGVTHLVHAPALRAFSLACQQPVGGFSKCEDAHPDLLHTYLSLAGLALLGCDGLAPLHPALNISQRAAEGLIVPLPVPAQNPPA